MPMINIASETTSSSLDPIDQAQVQPNAIDLKLARVWQMSGPLIISEQGKTTRNKYEIAPYYFSDIGYGWQLSDGSYEIQFEGTISVGADEAGFVITRSTFNRNGVFITSGLYDSGYTGSMAGCLHVNGGGIIVGLGTRIAQFLLWKAEALHMYNGSYGFAADGSVKNAEQQYTQ